jgi:four helix bundle protein
MPHNPNRLEVLRKAKQLAVLVHSAAERHKKRLGARAPTLRAQLLRAVDSIVLNIAEGAGKDSANGFVYLLDVAIASCNEVEIQLKLAVSIGALPPDADAMIGRVIEVRKMAIGSKATVRRQEQARVAERSRVRGQ